MADYTKYDFNGKKELFKNRLVLEVIKKYAMDNPNITVNEIKNIFDRKKFNQSESKKVLLDSKEKDDYIFSNFETRYFSEEDEVINIGNQKIYVSNQWGFDTDKKGRYFDAFLDFAKGELGYDIKVSNSLNAQAKEEHQNPQTFENKTKNIILYGVPGVGKTYSHKKLIDMIESKEHSDNDIFSSLEKHISSDFYDTAKGEDRVKFITFHQSFGYEDFIEGFRPDEDGNITLQDGIFKTFCDEAKENKEKNYYFVIDEINRGNISKIFGELITLVEPSKRLTLHVALPYSKKEFSIPSNLYIIGTMNSTDKSIALIDIALRRRFAFLKMEPNPEIVDNDEAKDMMKKLNEKITEILSEDYRIGHSYFMDIKNKEDLTFTCKYKIEPLLEEYFYGDDRVKEVLKIMEKES